MYAPALGRFLQTDPLGLDAGDLNLYRYVFNDVVNNRDPLGLKKCCGVEKGPEYVPSGTVKGGTWFSWYAKFKNDDTHDPKCCEVHQEIKSNVFPIHKGFPKDWKGDWIEDRNQEDMRYGHRNDGHTLKNMSFAEYPDDGNQGQDIPHGLPHGTVLTFRLKVIDVCNGNGEIYTGK